MPLETTVNISVTTEITKSSEGQPEPSTQTNASAEPRTFQINIVEGICIREGAG